MRKISLEIIQSCSNRLRVKVHSFTLIRIRKRPNLLLSLELTQESRHKIIISPVRVTVLLFVNLCYNYMHY
jgi:hypothetical protein